MSISTTQEMTDDCEYKVYCYFLESSPDELYAFTINKEYSKDFSEQRCMKKFVKGTIKMSALQYQIFSNANSSKMLHRDFLGDDSRTYSIVATPVESDRLTEYFNYISDTIASLNDEIKNEEYVLKKKYLKFIAEITDKLMDNSINTFKLFLSLFHDTIVE